MHTAKIEKCPDHLLTERIDVISFVTKFEKVSYDQTRQIKKKQKSNIQA